MCLKELLCLPKTELACRLCVCKTPSTRPCLRLRFLRPAALKTSVRAQAWSKDEKKATKKVSKVMAKPGPQGGLAAYSLGTQAAKGKLTDKAYGKVFATACAQPGKAPKNAAKSYGSVIVRGGKEAKACAVALAQSVTFTVVVKVEVVVLAVAEVRTPARTPLALSRIRGCASAVLN